MSWEQVGLLCILIGVIVLPYALLYTYVRARPGPGYPTETIPYEPFAIFSTSPVWRKCISCGRYDYSTNTLCHEHALPTLNVPLAYKMRYRVARMSTLCLRSEEIEENEREDFEYFLLLLMEREPEMYWSTEETVNLYRLDERVDHGGGGEYATH